MARLESMATLQPTFHLGMGMQRMPMPTGMPVMNSFDLAVETKVGQDLMDESSALAVLHREAVLRREEVYLGKARPYVLNGEVPPVELDQDVQAEALQRAGQSTDQRTVQAYQARVRRLRKSDRSQYFFLKANDTFFHPHINVVNKILSGPLVLLDGTKTNMDHWLQLADSAGCSKLFIVASTSS